MKKIILSLIFILSISTKVFAHFQMLYTPQLALTNGKSIEVRLIFTHPFTNEFTMNMGKQHDTKGFAPVEEFYVINKGKKRDLKNTLQDIIFNGKNSKGHAYSSKYKARKVGDHILILKPSPYYVKSEDYYIQQITKTIVNVLGVPSDWDKELNLQTEIVPLTKPYSIWEGGSFTGIVKSQGKLVPYANIDVEYLNTDVNLKTNSMGKSKIKAPQGSFITLRIKANKEGEFTFAIPKAGYWGFSAISSGPKKKYKGKKLRQDAVIWVKAKAMELNK